MNPSLSKKYYDITEVAEIVGCPESTLRFWESQFPHLNPKRDVRNRRKYTQADIEIIKKIQYQKNTQGRTLEGARTQLNHRETAQNVIHKLERLKSFLETLKSDLQ